VEEWSPSADDPAPAERPLLDRWLLSRLHTVSVEVMGELEAYQLTRAYRLLGDFVIEDLSNWYVRRSRARFWGNAEAADMRAAFRTLWEALRQVAILAAPVTPFSADWLHRALAGGESVHLERFPDLQSEPWQRTVGRPDSQLEADMNAARALVSLGRAAREEVQIRVRQPLRGISAVVPGGHSLPEEVLEVVRDELNVKSVGFLSSAEGIVTLAAKPNFRAIGSRFGKQTNEAADAIRALSQEALARYRDGDEVHIELNGDTHTLEPGDVEILQEAVGDLVVKGEGAYTVALDPELDDQLRAEGVARELVNRIQRLRKEAGLEITDRIDLAIAGPEPIQAAADQHRDFIARETLALSLDIGKELAEDEIEHMRDVELDGSAAHIGLRPAVR
jgi:isoleucyl-tRNA synthetase